MTTQTLDKMTSDTPSIPSLPGVLLAVLLLVLASWLCFSPGVGSGYQFDDVTSVAPLQTLRENPDYFWYFVFSDTSGPLGRPLSIFSFAVEQRFFAATPDFSQRVSIGLHAINGTLFFVLLLLLMRVTRARQPLLLAALGALLWVCAPQKASTVLYIVQRMASLTCFFSLLAMVAYVLARQARETGPKIAAGALCLVSIVAAPFAKEVGALVPFYLATLEVFVLGPLLGGRLRTIALLLFALGMIGFAAVGFYEFSHAETRYAVRNFGFAERLLSMPAVLLDYLRQFFVPDTARLGLLHDDYPVVTTAASPLRFLLPLSLLGAAALWTARCVWRGETSLVACGLAIFFLGHSIEGSFIPLELFFEHRNYTPSAGLVIALVGALAEFGRDSSRAGSARLANFALGLAVVSLAFSSWNFTANWRNGPSLLEHHLEGHPRSSRIHSEHALKQAATGRYDEALVSVQRAYDLSLSEPAARSLGLGDLGLLRAVVACLAGESLTAGLPPVDGLALKDPIRSAGARSLRKMFEDGICPNADWDGVSTWIAQVVAAGERAERRNSRFKAGAMQDLANLEKALEHYLPMYMYAAMASELRPGNGVLVLLKIEAAVQLGDARAYEEGVAQLRELAAAGNLSPAERQLLQRTAPHLLAPGAAAMDEPGQTDLN